MKLPSNPLGVALVAAGVYIALSVADELLQQRGTDWRTWLAPAAATTAVV